MYVILFLPYYVDLQIQEEEAQLFFHSVENAPLFQNLQELSLTRM